MIQQAATIPCAGVTAWTALDGLKAAAPRSALLQGSFCYKVDDDMDVRKVTNQIIHIGTGGVSLFALLICLAAGIQPIITSSSDKKLEDIRNQLGPDVVRTINYRTVSDQAAEVQRLTNGKGVDFVVNNTGPASIPQDISFLRQRGGLVSLVGFLEGFGGDWQPSAMMALMSKFAKLK